MEQQTRYRSEVPDDVIVEEELSEGISVRLTPGMLRQLRERARSVGIGPSTLARMWIVENLKEPEGRPVRQVP